MSDTEVPADLVALKREFLAVDAAMAELARKLPSAAAIVSDEAKLTDEQRRAWEGLQVARSELAVQIHRHPAFEGLSAPERLALDSAASRAVKAFVPA